MASFKKKKKKEIDLSKETTANEGAEVESRVTEALLLELCPPKVLAKFQKATMPAQRADLLYSLDKKELKELRDAFKLMDTFLSKLEAWFIQEMQDGQTGVSGKLGRVEVKNKEVARVDDWALFYAHVAKRKEFDLLNKAPNQKAIQARWEEERQVPGVSKFNKRVISLTGVKSK